VTNDDLSIPDISDLRSIHATQTEQSQVIFYPKISASIIYLLSYYPWQNWFSIKSYSDRTHVHKCSRSLKKHYLHIFNLLPLCAFYEYPRSYRVLLYYPSLYSIRHIVVTLKYSYIQRVFVELKCIQ
jgi:hypothetical protein